MAMRLLRFMVVLIGKGRWDSLVELASAMVKRRMKEKKRTHGSSRRCIDEWCKYIIIGVHYNLLNIHMTFQKIHKLYKYTYISHKLKN